MSKMLSIIGCGFVVAYALDSEPDGWMLCNGQYLDSNNQEHDELYSQLVNAGYPYGSYNGHPKVPDLRGEFIRGLDKGRGADPDSSRGIGTTQNDEFKEHSHTLTLPPRAGDSAFTSRGPSWGGDDWVGSNRTATTADSGGDETRPRNMALNYLIKL